ncbi:UNVERIFIED_ORG: acetylornithine deacetylase [Martelella mediterranea]
MTHIEWLSRLIAYPTISSDSNLELIETVQEALVARGAVVKTFPDPTGKKASLLARLGPEGNDGLMLSAHVDVVPVAGQSWTHPPFELTRDDERLYGRGTTDMKGFVACVLAMAEALETKTLTKPLWIALSYDEEVGCAGVGDMLSFIKGRGIRPDFVVVGEPTSLRIGVGHKGKIGYRADCHGLARHSAEAPLALNALHLATDIVVALRKIQADLVENGAREEGYSVPYATVHSGVLNGGTAVNIVPSTATLIFEARFPVIEDSTSLDKRIRQSIDAISNEAALRLEGTGIVLQETLAYPGLAVDPRLPALRRFASCLPDGTETCRLSFGTEGGLFSQALGVPVVVCGPGDMTQGHQPDEFIEASQLEACNAMLGQTIELFCGSASEPSLNKS